MIRLWKPILRPATMLAGLLSLANTVAQVTVSISAPPVAPGEVTLAILTVEQAADIAGADLVINGPEFILPGTAQTTAVTSDFLVASRSQPGRIQIALARAQGLAAESATILQIPLQIAKTAPVGTFAMTFDPVRFYTAQPAARVGKGLEGALTVMAPAADLDGDGLPDSWESHFFSTTQSAAEADADGDGISNAQEFLAGTDPTAAGSVFRILNAERINRATAAVALIQWAGGEGKSYQIQWSDGPIGPQTVWHQVYNPDIHQDGLLFSWMDDGTRTHVAPEAVHERYYRILIPSEPP